MIKRGDIVFRRFRGGIKNAKWYWQHDLEKIRFGKDNKNEY